MKTHPYLRAYMAGITVPTILLIFIVAAFFIARHGFGVLFSIEQIIVFPMAVVPNLWGVWNILYIRLRRHRYISIGLHGALLALVQALAGFGFTRMVDFEIPGFISSVFPYSFPVLVIVFYLVWKHLVAFFNAILGIE